MLNDHGGVVDSVCALGDDSKYTGVVMKKSRIIRHIASSEMSNDIFPIVANNYCFAIIRVSRFSLEKYLLSILYVNIVKLSTSNIINCRPTRYSNPLL